MKILGIIILILLGGFTGLCSAAFTIGALAAPDNYLNLGSVAFFVVPGFLISWGAYAGVRALTRKPPPPNPIAAEPKPPPPPNA
ncbi:MAG: hypothetical protein ACOH2H_01990 [Cypionkella sp.]